MQVKKSAARLTFLLYCLKLPVLYSSMVQEALMRQTSSGARPVAFTSSDIKDLPFEFLNTI
jgi:hypothetical protein